MPWLRAFVTLRAVVGQGDGVKKCMGRRQDGCRDRLVDDHLLAMRGLGDLDEILKGDILQLLMALKGSTPMLATSLECSDCHLCRNCSR